MKLFIILLKLFGYSLLISCLVTLILIKQNNPFEYDFTKNIISFCILVTGMLVSITILYFTKVKNWIIVTLLISSLIILESSCTKKECPTFNPTTKFNK